jgi:hypothetical protein
MINRLVRKLSNCVDLPEGERRALADLADKPRSVGARTDLVREDEPTAGVYLILTRWACRYRVLPDGERQIMACFIPGDLCDQRIFILKQMDHCIMGQCPRPLAAAAHGMPASLHGKLDPSTWPIRSVSSHPERKADPLILRSRERVQQGEPAMKTPLLAAALIALAGPIPAQAQPQAAPAQSETPMPMGQMMQGMPQGRMEMMQGGMRGGPGGGMRSRFSPEDMSAFVDAQIAAVHAGLKLSADQEKLWPPIETAIRNLATLHLSHMQAMRQNEGAMAGDRVALIRSMADRMSQGADALRKLADAAAPLYATLDEAQKRRLQVLAPMGPRGVMGPGGMMGLGMTGSGGAMMLDDADGDDDGQDNR